VHTWKRSVLAASLAAASAMAPLTAHSAQVGFSLTIDDSTNSLTSSLAGVAITVLGSQHWLVDLLGAGITISPGSGGSNMTWFSGPGDPGANWLHAISATQLELNGDWTGATPGLNSLCGASPNPLAQGVTCFVGTGGSDTFFVTVVDPAAAVPLPGTLALAGLALACLGAVARRKA
jgi:hypothetical protein